MDSKMKLKIGKLEEIMFLFSRGVYGRDHSPRLLKLAAIGETILEAYRNDPDGFAWTMGGFISDFQAEIKKSGEVAPRKQGEPAAKDGEPKRKDNPETD